MDPDPGVLQQGCRLLKSVLADLVRNLLLELGNLFRQSFEFHIPVRLHQHLLLDDKLYLGFEEDFASHQIKTIKHLLVLVNPKNDIADAFSGKFACKIYFLRVYLVLEPLHTFLHF